VLVAKTPKEISDLAAQLALRGSKASALPIDITRPEDVEKMAQYVRETCGRIDVLVTCAAAGPIAGPTETLPLREWQKVVDTDLTGTFLTCQAIGCLMLEQGYGRIVNIASFHAIATYPQRAAYAAAKSGVIGLTQALAVEWGGRGITVNAVAPGPIRTSRTAWFLVQDRRNEPSMIGRTPTGRLGEPEEVAATILFLASREARHVNGQTVVVDGGWTKNAWWGQHPWRG
jgi:NAD(P)-dependent dehydrogenase (short-subunit alcohol dehydrogenase family)